MFGRWMYIIVFPLLLIWFFSSLAGGENSGHLGFSKMSLEDRTLYFRKIGDNRLLDLVVGNQLVSENVAQFLFIWADYYAEKPFVLNSIALHLHLDAHIVDGSAASKIDVDIMRNGSIISTTNIYELPPGHIGDRQLDLFTNEDIYPTVTFNRGDELGFYFRRTDNLNPCDFRYNGAADRDDSHLTIEFEKPNFALIESIPIAFDLTLEEGEILDTTFEINNLGLQPVHYDLSLPQGQETLYHHDLSAALWWIISDQQGQDYYNVRFTPAQNCTLKSVRFRFFRNASSGNPDLMIYIWNDSGAFPGAKLDSTLIPYDAITFFPAWHVVELTGEGLLIPAHQDFHVGYTCMGHNPGDALALCSDDRQLENGLRRT